MKRHIVKHLSHLPRHLRLTLLIIPVLLLSGYIGYRIFVPAPTKKPLNIILISIDSLRPDHMSTYGYARKTTPNIDAWAKDAVIFNNYFSTSYLTPISEVSVHTGKYPFTTGVVNFQCILPTSTPNLAQILKGHGYATAAFGSSAEFSGYSAGHSLSRGFDTYDLSTVASDIYNGRGRNSVVAALPWVKTAEKSDKPFFLWIPLGSAHWPYGQGEPSHFSSSTYSGYFQGASQNTWGLVDYLFEGKVYGRVVRNGPLFPVAKLNENDFDYILGRYDDGILMTDRRVGQLLSYLKTSGLDQNTLVILESEHGEGFNERGYILHYDIFDEQVHTPLIIKAPSLKPQQINALASGVDVLPTILEILKLPQVPVEGNSLLPLINGTETNPRQEVFLTRTALWERIMSDYEDLYLFLAIDDKEHFADTAIRTKNWKLIHRRSHDIMTKWSWHNKFRVTPKVYSEFELYDLMSDPGEKTDIYEREKTNPEIVYLEDRLGQWEFTQFKTKVPAQHTSEIQPYF